MELNDALALEYQSHYGSALRDIDVSDLVNNPSASGKCRVLSLGFQEEWLDLIHIQARPLVHDGRDALLIGQQRVQPLP